MHLPRTTGAMSGLLIVILGVWGGVIPFVGAYFHYAFGSYATWHYTHQRLWLDILPGAVAVLGGLLLLTARSRASGLFAGAVALIAGAWFGIGVPVSLLWHASGDPIGAPMGGHIRQALELIGFFYGLGVAIAALAAFAMGRFVSRPHLAAEASASDRAAAERSASRRSLAAERAARRPRAAETSAGADTDPGVPE